MLVAMVLLGGIKRIGSVSERLVPFMALFYIVLAVGVVILNIQRFPAVIEAIFAGAFNPAAFTGGTIGSLFISMQKGVSRGIFSNEAGLGSAPMAHAATSETDPVKQGLYGIFEVFMDTIVICSLSGLTILCAAEGRCAESEHWYGRNHCVDAQALGSVFTQKGGAIIIAVGLGAVCVLHHPELGAVWHPVLRIPLWL